MTFKAPPFKDCHQHPLLVLLLAALALYLAGSQAAHAATPAKRVVSLAPALTEMLYAVGAGNEVVGVSAYSDFPAAARSKPVVGDALHVDEERIIALHPDLVVAAEGDARRLERLRSLTRAQVVVMPTRHVADVWTHMKELGHLTGHAAQAEAEVARRLARVHELTVGGPKRKTVFYMVWDQPLMTAGHDSYLQDLIELAGARNVAEHAPGAYPNFGWETMLAANPDVILGPTKLAAGLKTLQARYPHLKAVQSRHVRTVPDDIVSRPGPRVVEALMAVEAAIR